MHRNLATALKNQGATFKSFRARCCLSFAKARRFACSTECHMVPLKCLNQESRLALTEQCQEGTDVNRDVFLWQHNFCSFSVAGAAKGHGALTFPTALCQPNASVSLISSAIASRICYCVKQALSPNPKMLTETLAFSSSVQLKKPLNIRIPRRLHALYPVTSHSSSR